MEEYWGHSENGNGNGVRESLRAHIQRVTDRAVSFAAEFGAQEQARLAALLHDLGKYTEQFKRRLDDPTRERGRDHASVGALVAAQRYKSRGILSAIAIEGHHTGLTQLQEWPEYAQSLARAMLDNRDRFTSIDVPSLIERFERDEFDLPRINSEWRPSGEFSANDMLDARMLFSTLVDADFLETEAHFEGDAQTPRRPRPQGPILDAKRALDAVEARIAELRHQQAASHAIHSARQSLISACLEAAVHYPPGLFTLSAPTGSGKTLAMLAFALRHALTHGLRRVVLVMPFLNIIDQTAKEYRSIFSVEAGFPPNFVIEDHSNVQPPERAFHSTGESADSENEASRLGRLLAENWDAPIVLTTSVQCLESLMSNRPGACRKLHRLAKSVILFDEVQTLPPHLAAPTLATLSRLAERFGATILFATATQPAFDHFDELIRTGKSNKTQICLPLARLGWRATEVVPGEISRTLFTNAAQRVHVRWRHTQPLPWESLADELARARQVLCIVNLKRHASRLAGLLAARDSATVFHLSTNMCPAHRMAVLDAVQTHLSAHRAVRLVATQCIEAGVDIDFPLVYRALGPLEAIAQAAGRCNRHGSRPEEGEVHVFQPAPDGKWMLPPGAYAQASSATETFLTSLLDSAASLDDIEILNDRERLRTYYRQFYALTGAASMPPELRRALDECSFADVARLYHLIPGATINILVPYDEQRYRDLRGKAEDGFSNIEAIRDWIRRARPHAVSLHRPGRDSPIWCHLQPVQFSHRHRVDNDEAEWFLPLSGFRYSASVGLGEFDDFPIG